MATNVNFPDKLTPVQVSTCETGNEKAGYSSVRRESHPVGLPVPDRMDNGRLVLKTFFGTVADQVIGKIPDWQLKQSPVFGKDSIQPVKLERTAALIIFGQIRL